MPLRGRENKFSESSLERSRRGDPKKTNKIKTNQNMNTHLSINDPSNRAARTAVKQQIVALAIEDSRVGRVTRPPANVLNKVLLPRPDWTAVNTARPDTQSIESRAFWNFEGGVGTPGFIERRALFKKSYEHRVEDHNLGVLIASASTPSIFRAGLELFRELLGLEDGPANQIFMQRHGQEIREARAYFSRTCGWGSSRV